MTKPKKMQMGGVPRRPMTMPSRATMTGPAKGSALSGAPGGRGVAGAYNQALAARNAIMPRKSLANDNPIAPRMAPNFADVQARRDAGLMNKTMPPVPPYQDPTPMDTTMRNDLPPVRQPVRPGLDPNTIRTRALIEQKRARNVEPPPPSTRSIGPLERSHYNEQARGDFPSVPQANMRAANLVGMNKAGPYMPEGVPPIRGWFNQEPPPPAPFKKGGRVAAKGKAASPTLRKAAPFPIPAKAPKPMDAMPRHMAGKMPMKMAAGGVAKIRHQQVNKGGRPPGRGPGMKGGTI